MSAMAICPRNGTLEDSLHAEFRVKPRVYLPKEVLKAVLDYILTRMKCPVEFATASQRRTEHDHILFSQSQCMPVNVTSARLQGMFCL